LLPLPYKWSRVWRALCAPRCSPRCFESHGEERLIYSPYFLESYGIKSRKGRAKQSPHDVLPPSKQAGGGRFASEDERASARYPSMGREGKYIPCTRKPPTVTPTLRKGRTKTDIQEDRSNEISRHFQKRCKSTVPLQRIENHPQNVPGLSYTILQLALKVRNR